MIRLHEILEVADPHHSRLHCSHPPGLNWYDGTAVMSRNNAVSFVI